MRVFELLRRRDAAAGQLRLALELQLRAFQLSPIALQDGLRLRELRLEGAVVEREQKVAFLDVLAFLEVNVRDLPVDARLDDHCRNRLDGADRAHLNRRRQDLGDTCDYGLGGGRARAFLLGHFAAYQAGEREERIPESVAAR